MGVSVSNAFVCVRSICECVCESVSNVIVCVCD